MTVISNSRVRFNSTILFFFICIPYGLILYSLPLTIFLDRTYYLEYAASSGLILINNYLSGGIVSVFFNEPLWLLINIALSQIFQPEQILEIIILFPSVLFSYTLAKKIGAKNFLLVLLIILFPQVLQNYITHLRQGLALAIFMYGILNTKRAKLYTLFAALIHSSFYFILVFQLLELILVKMRLNLHLKVLVYFLSSVFLIIVVDSVASLIGDRRGGQYSSEDIKVSGLGWIFWLIFFFLLLLRSFPLFKKPNGALPIFIFYLTSYFSLAFVARIFESMLPYIFTGLKDLKPKYYYLLFGLLFSFCVAQWVLFGDSLFILQP
jgi:hypothetical protein